jgi:hypothetical protein
MALQINKELNNTGLVVENLYARVGTIEVSNKDSLYYGVEYFKDSDKEALMSSSYSCVYNIEGDNPIKQAYEYLKTLPEFADAVDV